MIFSENVEENFHEGDIKLSASQEIALELYGDPTAPLVGARGLIKDRKKLWTSLVVPYNITSELGIDLWLEQIRGYLHLGATHVWETIPLDIKSLRNSIFRKSYQKHLLKNQI